MADRNLFRLVVGILGCMLLGPDGANALDWPTRPVTIVVPLAAGGNTDMMARIAAQRLSEKFGQPFVVAELQAQRAEGIVDDLCLVGAEEDQVPGLRLGT